MRNVVRLVLVLSMALAVGNAWRATAGADVSGEQVRWEWFVDGGFMPSWRAVWAGSGTLAEVIDGRLRIADLSTAGGSGRTYTKKWRADPASGATVEARLKVTSCSAEYGVNIGISNGVHEEGITFFPDRVTLSQAGISAPFDTMDAFHTYRIRVEGTDITVHADGKPLIDGNGKFATPAIDGCNAISFGCGASGAMGDALWEFVRYETGRRRIMRSNVAKVRGVKIETGDTVTIKPGANYAGFFKFADGSIIAAGMGSYDGGRTWTEAQGIGNCAFQFADGETISLGFLSEPRGDGQFELPLYRSLDNWETVTEETALLNIPEGTGGMGDDGTYCPGPPVDHATIQLANGNLLTAMYGYFKGDTVLCEAFPAEWKLYKYRTWVMESADRGKTWDYLSTVAYDPTIGIESFCEACLVPLPNGDILSLMRTGGNRPFSPLYQARSKDQGKTWGDLKPVADIGVWPNCCLMGNGVLVATYGRPNNFIMFSTDYGETWKGHTRIYEGPSSSYNSIVECAPDQVLVIYDRQMPDAEGNMVSEVCGTFFTVQRQAQ